MKPGNLPLRIEAGATYRKMMQYLPGGAPMDFTGYTAKLQMTGSAAPEVLLMELTTENGGITLDSEGNITLYMPPADTLALYSLIANQTCSYEFEIAQSPTEVIRLLRGGVTVNRELYS